jgi:hypothetical protein
MQAAWIFRSKEDFSRAPADGRTIRRKESSRAAARVPAPLALHPMIETLVKQVLLRAAG